MLTKLILECPTDSFVCSSHFSQLVGPGCNNPVSRSLSFSSMVAKQWLMISTDWGIFQFAVTLIDEVVWGVVASTVGLIQTASVDWAASGTSQ